jgi:uncharacterized protein (TIGR03083 family)
LSQVAPWETWEWPVPPGTTSTSLAETVERTTADLLASIAPLSEEFLDTPGTFDRWSGRDVIGHCVSWAEVSARILESLVSGTMELIAYRDLPVGEETGDELNQRQVDEIRGEPTDALTRRLRRAGDRAADALRRIDGDPPAILVLMTFGDHFDEHVQSFRKVAGD